MTAITLMLAFFLLTGSAHAQCPDDTLFGVVHSVVDTTGSGFAADPSRLAMLHRKDGGAVTSIRPRPRTPLCFGDVLETWHDTQVWIDRPGLGSVILEGGVLLKLDAEPRILRGRVNFFLEDDLPQEDRKRWVVWAGNAYYHSLQSKIQIGIDDVCSEDSIVTVGEGESHSVDITRNGIADVLRVTGGQSILVSSSGASDAPDAQARVLRLEAITVQRPTRRWPLFGAGIALAAAGSAGVGYTMGQYTAQPSIDSTKWTGLQIENALSWAAVGGGGLLVARGLTWRTPK